MDLSELSKELKSSLGSGELSPLHPVDISPFLGQPEGTIVLQ